MDAATASRRRRQNGVRRRAHQDAARRPLVPDFQPVFHALRAILHPYAERLVVTRDDANEFYLDTHHVMENGRSLFFGAVQVKKRYVSFHLMPVYERPELLVDVSADLRARMQGKSCFNFTRVDEESFAELAALVAAGHESYRQRGYV
jgi:hypothetical protein